jgi:hypothetical protein
MGDDRPAGSDWYFAVMEGLADPKHCDRMGKAVWGYIALLRIADFQTGHVALSKRGIVTYFQEQLGKPRPTAYRWRDLLIRHNYISCQDDHTVITKYRSPKTFCPNSDKLSKNGQPAPENLRVEWTPSILYRDLTYRTLKGFYEAALDMINQASNPIAELRQLWAFVWGSDELPDFGRLGRAAKRAGNGKSRPGCRVLLQRAVVAAVGRRVVGNPIDYVSKMGGDGNGRREDHPLRGHGRAGSAPGTGESDWTDPERHGDWGQFVTTADDDGDRLP